MAAEDGKDERIAKISSAIRVIPDFPKPGDLTFQLSDCSLVFFLPIICLAAEKISLSGISEMKTFLPLI